MDQTAATVANLIRYRLPEYPKVLEVGCAGGTLAGELPPSVHYLGIDASESAIEAAQSLWGGDDILFAARDIREFDPVGDWDAIVFSEVLSYLSAHEAIAEVRRYAEALSPEGVVAISMMNDGKSRAIWRAKLMNSDEVVSTRTGLSDGKQERSRTTKECVLGPNVIVFGSGR